MALSCAFLSPVAAFCNGAKVYGGFRNAGNAATRHHAGERGRAAAGVLENSLLTENLTRRRLFALRFVVHLLSRPTFEPYRVTHRAPCGCVSSGTWSGPRLRAGHLRCRRPQETVRDQCLP